MEDEFWAKPMSAMDGAAVGVTLMRTAANRFIRPWFARHIGNGAGLRVLARWLFIFGSCLLRLLRRNS